MTVCVCVNIGRRERWSYQDSSCPRTPTERCYQPAVADPDSSYIEVKINSPDMPVCLSEDDGLHTFLLCTQVLCLLALPRFHLSSSSLPSSVSPLLPPLSALFSVLLALPCSALVFGERPCLFNDERMKGSSSVLSLHSSFHPLLSPFPRGLAVMFNQRDKDRTFHRDKVNGTMRGLTKLLTPRQLNMNKRCARFFFVVFFPRHCTALNISRNKLVLSLFCIIFLPTCRNLSLSPVNSHISYNSLSVERFINTERSHVSAMNTITVMTMRLHE